MALTLKPPKGYEFAATRRRLPDGVDLKERCSRIDAFNTLGVGSAFLNPDDLVRRKGLAIYEYMGRDDQVHAVLTLKKHARLSTGWEILPASGSEEDKRIAEFVRYTFEKMTGSMDQKIYEIMSALQYGYSLSEKLWTQFTDGPWKGHVGYRDIKTRSPFCFEFILNPANVEEEFGITLVSGHGKKDQIETSKMVHYPYNADFGNPYGHSDLRAAYRSWFSKDFTYRFMNIYIEKNAVPPILFEIPDNVDGPEITRLKLFAQNWQTQTSGTIPQGVKPIIPESKFGGALSFKFQEIIELHNTAIARAILIPDLLGFSSKAKGGSLGASKHQTGIFFFVLDKIAQDLEETVFGEQIIKPLVDFNFKNILNYPRFRFKPLEQENPESRGRIIQMMVGSGVIAPDEPWIRPYLSLPNEAIINLEQDRIFRSMQRLYTEDGVKLRTMTCGKCVDPVGVDFVLFNDQVPYHPACFRTLKGADFFGDGKVSTVHLEDDGKRNVIEDGDTTQPAPEPKLFQEIPLRKDQEIPNNEFRRSFTEFETGMPYSETQTTLNVLDKEALAATDRIFSKIRQDLEKDIVSKRILAGKPENMAKLKINIGPFRKLLLNLMSTGALNGQFFSVKEASRRGRQYGIKGEGLDLKPLTKPESASAGTRKLRRAMAKRGGDTLRVGLPSILLDFFESRAFRLAGTESQRILDSTKAVLENQLKQGYSGDLKKLLGDVFNGWISSASKHQSAAVRTRGAIRLTVLEGFNEGRRVFYLDPMFEDILQGFQWSAVIDNLTSLYCRAMDQKVFRVDEIIGFLPPAHPFCRSVVVPIFKDDEFGFTNISPVAPKANAKRPAMFTTCDDSPEFYTEGELDYIYGDERCPK